MDYYWSNRQEILQTAKGKYSREKAAEYYAQRKEAMKQKSRELYKVCDKKKKKRRLKSTKEKYIKNWFSIKKKR